MKNLIVILLLMTGGALAQTTDKCREILDSETICIFADGSATVVWHPAGEYNSTHYTAAQWAKDGPAVESDASSLLEQRRNDDAVIAARLEADRAALLEKTRKATEKSEADLAQAEAALRIGMITNRKKCLASGYAWTHGVCSPKDAQ